MSRRLARAVITACFLVLCLVVPVSAEAGPQLVTGLMCDTAAEIDAFYRLHVVEGRTVPETLAKVNAGHDKRACGSIAPAGFMMAHVTLRKREFHGDETFYFYSGEALGFVLPNGRAGAFAAPMEQHFVLAKPIDPADATTSI